MRGVVHGIRPYIRRTAAAGPRCAGTARGRCPSSGGQFSCCRDRATASARSSIAEPSSSPSATSRSGNTRRNSGIRPDHDAATHRSATAPSTIVSASSSRGTTRAAGTAQCGPSTESIAAQHHPSRSVTSSQMRAAETVHAQRFDARSGRSFGTHPTSGKHPRGVDPRARPRSARNCAQSTTRGRRRAHVACAQKVPMLAIIQYQKAMRAPMVLHAIIRRTMSWIAHCCCAYPLARMLSIASKTPSGSRIETIVVSGDAAIS